MTTFRSFEDIGDWQKGRELVNRIYQITAAGKFAKDFGLKDQIRRASVSIISNIAEGFERGGDKEFGQFLSVAKGSVVEVKSQLYLASDQGYLSNTEFEELRTFVDNTSRLIGGLMSYLKRSKLKGSKYS